MTSTPQSAAGTPGAAAPKRRRRYRTKPYLPRWLKRPGAPASIARSRCLMLLSVLSGQRSVSEAIGEARISRAQFYQLEARALRGMMSALDPLDSASVTEREELGQARSRIRALSAQVKLLTQRKRGAERLLRLVLKSSRTPMQLPRRGRRPKVEKVTMPGADSP